MRRAIKVLMDLPPSDASHLYTVDALHHSIVQLAADVDVIVEPTDAMGALGDGVVIGPGSPYRDPIAAEAVIEAARREGIPLVGT